MVDVSEKQASTRIALATGKVIMQKETLALIKANDLKKGDVLATARVAGIQGAKQCSSLIPLCHPLMISKVSIDFDFGSEPDEGQSENEGTAAIYIRCECKLVGQTGVEMEALTGVSVAALTIYDMCKAVDPSMVLTDIKVQQKIGGKTGFWEQDKA
jgi:cyclic pyranopterin phosphate synthase